MICVLSNIGGGPVPKEIHHFLFFLIRYPEVPQKGSGSTLEKIQLSIKIFFFCDEPLLHFESAYALFLLIVVKLVYLEEVLLELGLGRVA